jgi:hypothetical protein
VSGTKPGDRKVGGLRHFALVRQVDAEPAQLDDRRSAQRIVSGSLLQ